MYFCFSHDHLRFAFTWTSSISTILSTKVIFASKSWRCEGGGERGGGGEDEQDCILNKGPMPPPPSPWHFLYLRETPVIGVEKKEKMSIWRPMLLQGAWVKSTSEYPQFHLWGPGVKSPSEDPRFHLWALWVKIPQNFQNPKANILEIY